MRITLTFLCTLLIILTSCRDEFTFTTPPERLFDYNVIAELKPQNAVSMQLLESVPIGNVLKNTNKSDAVAMFMGDDVPGGAINMSFNESTNQYHLDNGDFRVSEGRNYEVKIVVPDNDMDTVVASTFIPLSVGFSTQVIHVEKVPVNNLFSEHIVEVVLTLDDPIDLPAYYYLVPSRLISTLRITANDAVELFDSAETSALEVSEVLNNQNAIEKFGHLPGIIIDESRLSSSQLRFYFKTPNSSPLRDGLEASVSTGIDIFNRLHLELHTWSSELYDYHKWVDGQIRNQGSNLPTPAREISNISRASGVFGGASRRIDTPRVQ